MLFIAVWLGRPYAGLRAVLGLTPHDAEILLVHSYYSLKYKDKLFIKVFAPGKKWGMLGIIR
jgi:hypothetical protein